MSWFVFVVAETGVLVTAALLAPYLFFLVLTRTPSHLGPYKWLCLIHLLLAAFYALLLFLLKPTFVPGPGSLQVTVTGPAKAVLHSHAIGFRLLETGALVWLLLVLDVLVTILHRYRLLITPHEAYWLASDRAAWTLVGVLAVLFVVPLANWPHLLRHYNDNILTQDVCCTMQYRLFGPWYVGGLVWALTAAGVAVLLLVAVHANTLHILRDCRTRFLPETVHSQLYVYRVICLQSLACFLLLLLPAVLAALAIDGLIPLEPKILRVISALPLLHSLGEFLATLVFIRSYREFSCGLLAKLLGRRSTEAGATAPRPVEALQLLQTEPATTQKCHSPLSANNIVQK